MCVWFLTVLSPVWLPDLCLTHSWDRETIQLMQPLIPRETGRFEGCCSFSAAEMNLYLTVIPARHVPLAYCAEDKHSGGYLRSNRVFAFKMVFCCFNCFSSFQVLFIADAKISFDSFRSGMVATVNSKSIITVNPGKRSQRHLKKHRLW